MLDLHKIICNKPPQENIISGMKFQIGYTPTADDAYMLFGLTSGAVDTGDFQIEPVAENLPTLNDHASRSQFPLTMISAAAYPLVRNRYSLLSCGASFGLGCGPVIISREPISETELDDKNIAIPGATTTAYAMLQIYKPTLRTRILPLDKLIPAVETGLVDGALVIHEEFVTYQQWGLRVVADLGKWWAETHHDLPMPVSCCVVRKDLPADQQQRLAELIRKSAEFALANHSQAMAGSLEFSTDSDASAVERFVRQYVNDLSVDMGPTGRAALETFFTQAEEASILPPALPLEIVQAG